MTQSRIAELLAPISDIFGVTIWRALLKNLHTALH